MRTEQEIYDLIQKIAEKDERVRAVYMHGSRTKQNVLRDKYSDYDIVYVVTETDSFINNEEWLNSFGDIAFAFKGYENQNKFFKREINDLSRRYAWCMLFKDGSHIDLVIEIVEEALNHIHIKNKPIIVLLDKDVCLPDISPSGSENEYIKKPHEDEYTACCSGFWWFLNTVAKGIARDQLPYAKAEFNSKILLTLNRMIDWYIGIQTDFSVSTGQDGKYYKKYLPADVYGLYTKIYSDSDYENFWKAIFSSCDLFEKIACDVGSYFGFDNNEQEGKNMKDYLLKVKNGTL
jgi:aminoglycoside 6-adenylyltransferase